MIHTNVPFYSNTKDDTHCFQAALRMVFKYFFPDREFSWKALEELTAKKEGLWTWKLKGALSAKDMGLKVVSISPMDYEAFAARGGDYLIEAYGEEIGRAQIRHGDIEQERTFAKEYLVNIAHEERIPDLSDLESLLEAGYLVICNVNSRALNNKEGYAGHFVVVYGFDHEYIYFHDPGLPPQESRVVTHDQFLKGWAYLAEGAKNILAFSLPRE